MKMDVATAFPVRSQAMAMQCCPWFAFWCSITNNLLAPAAMNRLSAGLYFGAKESTYFAVGKITQDQVDSYAARKGMGKSEAERWLSTMLSYEP
jgi:hypothetical protein